MRKVYIILLVILFSPVYMVAFTVVHELGHTVLARLLGDPNSVFYLARIEEDSFCLGCNIYDPSRLSWGGNLVVSLGGLLATQLVALAALLILRLRRANRLSRQILGWVALGFAFLDVPVQVIQGLLYNLDHQTWPTNVDFVDFMLLIQGRIGASQLMLKGLLLTAAVIYLFGIVWSYKQYKLARKVEL